jgi:hypothetical protein
MYHEETDARGIDHLVVSRTGRCATFQDCGHEPLDNRDETE